jgi:hypothetical protein
VFSRGGNALTPVPTDAQRIAQLEEEKHPAAARQPCGHAGGWPRSMTCDRRRAVMAYIYFRLVRAGLRTIDRYRMRFALRLRRCLTTTHKGG